MIKFEKTLMDIKSVKIQGAESVAKASIEALISYFSKKKFKKESVFLSKFSSLSKRLMETRPTEPLLRNSIRFVEKEIGSEGDPNEMVKRMFGACRQALYHYEVAEKSIADIGSNKIEDGMKIFTHCHSSSVTGSLKRAKEQGKKFEVFNTETRPLFQGRITAKELAKAKIPVKHFVDSGARVALKECDLMFIGADAITSEGKVINKIGSEMFALVAEKYGVPVYVLADSWKFDPQSIYGIPEPIEKRSSKEVWAKAPRGVEILNIAFERVNPDLIAAIISELGVYTPENFVSEVRRTYPWLSR
ncbi:MAG: S-methyl-5-thioribose-1-phosphate isomerase [Candidatus Aenigmarchaeota archaeon]|nr:S-methyl-5-thioribose-1-phosphate isomerase [Candidatus Aenigmarchaeota archaeon]